MRSVSTNTDQRMFSTFLRLACSRTYANVLGLPPSVTNKIKAKLLQWRPRECRHARIYMVKYLKFYYHHNKYLFNFHNYSIFQEVYHSGSGPGSWSKVNDTRYKTKDIYHLFRGHKHFQYFRIKDSSSLFFKICSNTGTTESSRFDKVTSVEESDSDPEDLPAPW